MGRKPPIEAAQTDLPKTDRRKLLLGMGVAAGSALTSVAIADRASAMGDTQVTDAPASHQADVDQRVPFYGIHQAGIVTPRPAAGMLVSLDVIADTPADFDRMLRLLTQRIVFLTQGGTPPAFDPKLPPSDSGILGPVIHPENLTITVGLGDSLFETRPWLKHLKPRHLQRMAQFRNDALVADLCHGDISLQFCANTADTNIHALRDILKNMPEYLVPRWKQEGRVPTILPKPDGTVESARNFLGFRDGSANPHSGNAALMNEIVWVSEAHAEPDWAFGGTYQAVRIIRNFVERWDRTPLAEQERIVGRMKMSGAPMGGTAETDVPDYSKDPDGKRTRLDAHIRLANPRTPETQKNLILRRPFNYSNGITKNGQLDQGLLFIAYQADLERGFITVQTRLDGEPLEEYIKPIGGGYFFVLPGARDAGDYLGRKLVEAAAAGPPTRS
ncbi:iron uptake transporter deferrochelatase/peroxidase subunit [Hyphomicrobium sp.]|uniref:iron uptake transporter deferrochelatase/peroxidase subunit n=1 Tax=Hyphomicrobium sp. TaxID=82 RepID=UPI000FA05C69|nr:iron uptake transporter deferrochelatase/peroxidase subunit [Hyphomicrobium sp.]RUO97501.1 MAG: deferrochelatase/peroxidase EfeB [Hyphomicrobium sp.]